MTDRLAYSIDALAKATDVGRTKLYEEIAAGRLQATKVGGRTLILAEHARAWLARYAEAAA